MIRYLYLLLFTSFSIFSLKSVTTTGTALQAQIMIHASIRCTNFHLPISKTIHIPPNATIGAVRTTLANILQHPTGCEPHCGGIKQCPKATFKNAVNKAGTPVIINNAHETWNDNDTLAVALQRNNRNLQEVVIDFMLDEPVL